MKTMWLIISVLFLGVTGVHAADTAENTTIDLTNPTNTKPGSIEAATGNITATVSEVDYKTRALVLKDDEGNTRSMIVGPEVTRFEQVKKGDVVTVDFLVSVAVMVQSPDKKVASVEGTSTAIVRNVGKKPSGVVTQTDAMSATVLKIDAKKRTATLKGPTGDIIDVDVAPDVTDLENVKKGDLVLVKVTRSVALDVRKPEKKK